MRSYPHSWQHVSRTLCPHSGQRFLRNGPVMRLTSEANIATSLLTTSGCCFSVFSENSQRRSGTAEGHQEADRHLGGNMYRPVRASMDAGVPWKLRDRLGIRCDRLTAAALPLVSILVSIKPAVVP